MKKIILSIFFLAFAFAASAQSELKIKTSAQCEMCKASIEKKLKVVKGVKSAVLDVDSKVLAVSFDEKVTNADKIRKAVAKTGYSADEVVADKKAYKKLPDCCKKDGK